MYKMWRRSRSVITGDGAQYMMYDIRCTYGGDCDDAGDGDVQTRCIASLQQIYTAFYAHTATAATVLAAAYRRDASRLYNKYTRHSTHIRQRRRWRWRQRTDAMHRVSTTNIHGIRRTYGDGAGGSVQTRCIASLQQIYTAFYAHTATAATVLAAAYRRDASRLYNKYTRRSTHIRQRRCWRQRTDAMHRVSTMQYTIPSHDNIVLGKRQYSDSPLQQWNIKRDNKDDWFSITNVATKRCMTVESDGTRHGSYIIDDKYNGRDNQRFRFIPAYTL